MNSNGKALKSGMVYGIASVISAGMVFLTTPFFTRIMSKQAYGEYNNFISWYNIFSVMSFNLYASFISARRDFKEEYEAYVKSMCVLNFFIVAVWMVLTISINSFLTDIIGLSNVYIACMYIYIAFYQVFMMYQVNERFEYRYKISASLIIGVAFLTTGLSMLFTLFFRNQLLGRVMGQIIPTIMAGVLSVCLFFLKTGKVKLFYWKYALPICLPYIPHLLSLSILNSLDKTMISHMVGSDETAIYSVAYVCGSVISLVVGVLNNAFAPWMAEQLERGKKKRVNSFSLIYVVIFEIILIAVLLFAPELVYILGGEKYKDAVFLMPTVIIGCSMQLIYTMYVNLEQYNKKTGYMAIVSIMAALTNYVMNYFGINKFGYQVAALTTMISYLFLVIGHIFIVKKKKISIYNDSFNIIIIVINIIEVPIFQWLYDYAKLRYFTAFVYMIMLIIVFNKYRKDIIKFVKTIKG